MPSDGDTKDTNHASSSRRRRSDHSSFKKEQHQPAHSSAASPLSSTSSLPWSLYLLLVASHVAVMTMFFVIGTHHGSSILQAFGGAPDDCPLDGEALTRKAPLTDYYDQDSQQDDYPTIHIPTEVSGYIAGMARVSRLDFLQKLDSGFPLQASTSGNRDVVVLFDHSRSLPFGHDATKHLSYYRDTLQAIQNCRQLRVVTMDPRFYSSSDGSNRTCLALQGHTTEPHPLVNKWQRKQSPASQSKTPTKQSAAALLSQQFIVEPKLALPPKPVIVAAAQEALQEYLANFSMVMLDLKTIVAPIAKSHRNLVVVMVVTAGHLPLLMNYICACHHAGVDTSRIVVFAADAATYARLSQVISITAFDLSPLFATTPNSTTKGAFPDEAEYGTLDYARIMMSKIYAVHLVNLLGHDVLFQDVDLVPFKSNYIDYFVDSVANKRFPGFDLYMQYDHAAHLPQYAPYGGNSGFYYLRYNAKTNYLMSRLIRSGDLVLKTRSHQATLSMVLSDVASQYNVRVKVLSSESAKFPVGYHFHHDWDYMRSVMLGRTEPYLCHMNWNNDKETKRKFLQQMGLWYANDQCIGKTESKLMECCVAEPIVVCHYSDKPSKVQDCKSYPAIETNVSFW